MDRPVIAPQTIVGPATGRRVHDWRNRRTSAAVCAGKMRMKPGFRSFRADLVHWTKSETPFTPAGRPVDGNEQIPTAAFIGHLGQVFHVDVDVSRFANLEGAVFRPGRLGLQVAQVPHTIPPQATIKTRARHIRVQELPQRALCAIGSSKLASAKRSSSDTSSVWRRTTAMASCVGVSVQRENRPPDCFLLRRTPPEPVLP